MLASNFRCREDIENLRERRISSQSLERRSSFIHQMQFRLHDSNWEPDVGGAKGKLEVKIRHSNLHFVLTRERDFFWAMEGSTTAEKTLSRATTPCMCGGESILRWGFSTSTIPGTTGIAAPCWCRRFACMWSSRIAAWLRWLLVVRLPANWCTITYRCGWGGTHESRIAGSSHPGVLQGFPCFLSGSCGPCSFFAGRERTNRG